MEAFMEPILTFEGTQNRFLGHAEWNGCMYFSDHQIDLTKSLKLVTPC